MSSRGGRSHRLVSERQSRQRADALRAHLEPSGTVQIFPLRAAHSQHILVISLLTAGLRDVVQALLQAMRT